MPTLSEDRPLRLLFIGHSHLRCVRDAAAAAQAELALRQIHVDTLVLQQPAFDASVPADAPVPPVLAPSDWPALQARAAQADVVVLAVGGNAHVVFGLVEHPQPFDFELPEAAHAAEPAGLALLPGRQVVPGAMVAAALQHSLLFRRHRAWRAQLRACLPAALLQIESPPPVLEGRHLMQHPGFFGPLLAEHGPAPAEVRHKLWRLHSHLVAADCQDQGMTLLPAPAACNDAGYLARHALADDPTHAGPWYGRRVIEQLVRCHRPGFALG